MRQPVSSWLKSGARLSGFVGGGIVGRPVLPDPPEHPDPGPREDADRVRVVAAAGLRARVDGGGPSGCLTGVVGEAGDGGARAAVAGEAEDTPRLVPDCLVTGATPASAASASALG